MNQLTKQSSDSEIKRYFTAVLKLAKSREQFPVNLEEVWPLVYGKKSDAVQALQRDFIEDVDYQVLRQNPQNPNGGRPINEYKLSVSCLEYFIVKKVRPVFEVYRKVFHKTISFQLNPADPSIVKAKIMVAKFAMNTLNMNDSSKLLLVKSIGDPLGLPLPNYTESVDQLLSPTELLSRMGNPISTRDFNQKMIAAGLLEVKERPSSSGKTKTFKSLTKEGMKYGENQVNPSNPKETQPLYYVGMFEKLFDMVTMNRQIV
ncbi:MAG TPA: hypothetical protein DCP35_15415 [Butyricimonas sp.]|jgi:hypothetical protein|uniref:hypothetical protein n=1 Tax=Butyricimonas sp. TaxID=1969738 RepID=UPI000EBA353B|nr:hypothetical protein [Butyricimonas sp.]HAM85296.1 hypothetical protein [Butyricimonas sp.]